MLKISGYFLYVLRFEAIRLIKILIIIVISNLCTIYLNYSVGTKIIKSLSAKRSSGKGFVLFKDAKFCFLSCFQSLWLKV